MCTVLGSPTGIGNKCLEEVEEQHQEKNKENLQQWVFISSQSLSQILFSQKTRNLFQIDLM